MATKMDQRTAARLPTRTQSRVRFQGILDEAERLLLEQGFDSFSIPALAERLGYTRASIYHFFPTPQSVLNELSGRYFREIVVQIMEFANARDLLPWKELLAQVLNFVADFYNERPAARMLMLGGPLAGENFRIQEETSSQIGETFRILFQMRGFDLPREPDVAWIFVDIVDSVLRYSRHRYGRITDECRDEALRAATAYLEIYAEPASRDVRRAGRSA